MYIIYHKLKEFPPFCNFTKLCRNVSSVPRHKLMQVPELHMSLVNDSVNLQKQHLIPHKKSNPNVHALPDQPLNPPSPPPLPEHFTNLTNKEIRSVEKFVFFVGYGRSGHSIVASLMDAHPNVIIADEYYLFDKLANGKGQRALSSRLSLFNELYWNSYTCAKSGRRNSSSHHTKQYHLGVDGMWQGRFSQLKVIGEKTGGATAMLYHNHKDRFKTLYKLLEATAGVPLHALHVVRNPYDMAATVALYQASGQPDEHKVSASVQNKFNNIGLLSQAVDIVLRKAEAVSRMKADSDLDLKLLELHLDDLTANPRQEMMAVCKSLEVECPEEYLQACERKLFPSASKSRDVVFWSGFLKERIKIATRKFNFFNRYVFEGS